MALTSMVLHRSPALTAIYNELSADQRTKRVLDLGPMRPSTFNFFSDLKCNIHFEDINSFIADAQQLHAELQLESLKEYLQSQVGKQKFDAILAWDLFNYLTPDAIKTLLAMMQPYCTPNCLLQVFHYTQKLIPARPRAFKIVDQYFMELGESDLADRQTPQLATYQLLKHIPGYVVQEGLANKEGMAPGIAEYLLKYSPDQNHLLKRAVAKTEFLESMAVSGLPLHTSPSMASIQLDQRATLLDLGPSNHHNAGWLSKYFREVYSENIVMSLQQASTDSTGTEPAQLGRSALNFANQVRFDYVLLWDTLNFLNRAQIESIFSRLLPHLHTNTLIFAYLYLPTKVPAAPCIYKISNPQQVAIAHSGMKPMAFHQHNAIEFARMSPSLSVKQTFLLKPGMASGLTEYLFHSPATD
ncbi:hypothetical protein [Halioxenophilus sp. WMMB6]|uniref:hypothetical protein n=1 Tax=Halioxenophilus sp. WMMB6 TaxID=3073815 RepID=UPI00295EDF3D|nr:hypothetical protein [Halioxenophilus sp. WMMB6]